MKNKRLRKLNLALVIMAAGAGAAWADDLIQPGVSKLKLRAEAYVTGRVVTLRDVLIPIQADPRLMAEVSDRPVLTQTDAANDATISLAQVVDALAEAGVNMSRVLISGRLTCRVRFEPPGAKASVTPESEPRSSGRRRADPDAAVAGPTSLAKLLEHHIAAELAATGGTPQVEYERGAEPFLGLTSPPFDFSIRAPRSGRLGLRELTVIIRRDGRVQRTVRIGARVKLIKGIVVAAKPLNAGQFVRREDLKMEERIFDRLAAAGHDDLGSFVGKQLKKYIPTWGRLTAADVKSVNLVKRARPVTVQSERGNIRVRLTGVALDSGDLGDSVRVRMGDNRKDRRVLRGVVTGVGTVRLEGGA